MDQDASVLLDVLVQCYHPFNYAMVFESFVVHYGPVVWLHRWYLRSKVSSSFGTFWAAVVSVKYSEINLNLSIFCSAPIFGVLCWQEKFIKSYIFLFPCKQFQWLKGICSWGATNLPEKGTPPMCSGYISDKPASYLSFSLDCILPLLLFWSMIKNISALRSEKPCYGGILDLFFFSSYYVSKIIWMNSLNKLHEVKRKWFILASCSIQWSSRTLFLATKNKVATRNVYI